mmetsp:Transcript_6857/g.20108  ORF Transcript_6857/g.20108 Transcript_6857/m.20108 type:complete len:321 (-) Transcript_6857:34-996(-)
MMVLKVPSSSSKHSRASAKSSWYRCSGFENSPNSVTSFIATGRLMLLQYGEMFCRMVSSQLNSEPSFGWPFITQFHTVLAIRSNWPPDVRARSVGRSMLTGSRSATEKERSPLHLSRMKVHSCTMPVLDGSCRASFIKKQMGTTSLFMSQCSRMYGKNSGFSWMTFHRITISSWKHAMLPADVGRYDISTSYAFFSSRTKPSNRNRSSSSLLIRASMVRYTLKPVSCTMSTSTTGSTSIPYTCSDDPGNPQSSRTHSSCVDVSTSRTWLSRISADDEYSSELYDDGSKLNTVFISEWNSWLALGAMAAVTSPSHRDDVGL